MELYPHYVDPMIEAFGPALERPSFRQTPLANEHMNSSKIFTAVTRGFLLCVDKGPGDIYEIYPQKFLEKTWDTLEKTEFTKGRLANGDVLSRRLQV